MQGSYTGSVLDTSKQSFALLVEQAASQIAGQGWTILKRETDDEAAWHIVAAKAKRLRVVQIVPPATPPTVRQEARLRLGEAARLPGSLGSMEQWLAHVRPDGRCLFGAFLLNAQRWATTAPYSDVRAVYADLGIGSLPAKAA
jgi:hypothetical protein